MNGTEATNHPNPNHHRPSPNHWGGDRPPHIGSTSRRTALSPAANPAEPDREEWEIAAIEEVTDTLNLLIQQQYETPQDFAGRLEVFLTAWRTIYG